MSQETAKQKAAAEAVCRPASASPVIVAPCKSVLTVTYSIDIVSTKSLLQIPYAVAINGKVLPEYAAQSKNAIWKPPSKDKTGKYLPAVPAKIIVPAQAGDTVALYLNSDAAPAWRNKLLYGVTLGERSAVVHIEEKWGKLQVSDTPIPRGNSAGDIDAYTAPLTGAIWMSASHVYRSHEVDAFMPAGTRPEVVNAIKRIYDGLTAAQLRIEGPADGELPAFALLVVLEDSDNPKQNISNYKLLSDGVTRVHPAGFAALFNAAIENGIRKIVVTSCWRPMLGSIAHRLGMGLDVNYVGDVRLNRQELKTGKAVSRDADDNVSEEEVRLFKALEAARIGEKEALNQVEILAKSPDREGRAAAEDRSKKAVLAHLEARKAWNNERDKHEPIKVKAFRSTLLQCNCVGQLFDPWYMYTNTATLGKPNMQQDDNEKLHAHHLHITVHDRKIFTL